MFHHGGSSLSKFGSVAKTLDISYMGNCSTSESFPCDSPREINSCAFLSTCIFILMAANVASVYLGLARNHFLRGPRFVCLYQHRFKYCNLNKIQSRFFCATKQPTQGQIRHLNSTFKRWSDGDIYR